MILAGAKLQFHPITAYRMPEEIILTRDGRPVAKLVGEPSSTGRPILGRGRGKLIIVSEDDDHLQDFEEYM